MSDLEQSLREELVAESNRLIETGLNKGTSGNLSVRSGDRMLITPSAVMVPDLTPDKMASMPIDGNYGSWEGPLRPSTEWQFHLDIMRTRDEVGAIVHTHAPNCTILAMCRKMIPAAHYMVSVFGGLNVRCSGWALPGSKELSDEALRALEGRNACLLANHGMITLGDSLAKAMWRAEELENYAYEYVQTLMIGGPVILSDDEMAEHMENAKNYGVQSKD